MIQNNSELNNNMHSLMRIFYSISLKDYFAMLETYFGSTYKTKCQKLLLYSDADDNYLLKNKEEYAEINPDVTIGEMMKIALKLDRSAENNNMPYPQDRLDNIAYVIVKNIMIEPFYRLFETPDGKTTFNKVTNPKSRKDRDIK